MRRFIFNKSAIKKAIAVAEEIGAEYAVEGETSLLVPNAERATFAGALGLNRVKFTDEERQQHPGFRG